MQTPAKQTIWFIDFWTYLAWSSVSLVVVAGFASLFLFRPLLATTLQAQAEETVRLSPITIQPHLIGALRVDVTAVLPTNRWVTYEVQLRDNQDQILASALKQAWSESGTWQEEGESGTWQEDDLQAGLDIQPAKAETVTVAIAVLDYATTSNQALEDPVSFRIKVQEGVVDTRYLWTGFWGTSLIAVLSAWATARSGVRVLTKVQPDSEVGDRAIFGGPRTLVQIKVFVTADENTPATLSCRLRIRDGNGQTVYHHVTAMPMQLTKDQQGSIESAKGKAVTHLVLQQRGSYGILVQIEPDHSVDSTQLIVKERVRTFQAVDAIEISPQE